MSASTEEWQRWLDEYAGRLLLFARQQCRVAADAEDVLQEALVEAWSRNSRHGPPPLPLVYSMIRWRAIDRTRGADRRQVRETSALALEPDWFVSDVESSDDARVLQEIIAELPGEQRGVLTMKIWGELTFKEIAEALSTHASTEA